VTSAPLKTGDPATVFAHRPGLEKSVFQPNGEPTMRKICAWRILATVAGLVLTGIEVFGAYEYLLKQEGRLSYLVAGGAVVTATSALLPILAERQWRDGHKLQALLLWAALLPALSLILSAAIERTGGARDRAGQERQAIETRIKLAKDAVDDAKSRLASAEAGVLAETKDKGCGPVCKGLKKEAEEARKQLSEARGAPDLKLVVPRDPQAVRLAAMLPVTEAQVALYQPVILPVTVSLLGILLLGTGLAETKRKRRVQKGKKKQVKRKRKPAKPKMPEPIRRKKHLALVASNEN
jgi:hypothetical protein